MRSHRFGLFLAPFLVACGASPSPADGGGVHAAAPTVAMAIPAPAPPAPAPLAQVSAVQSGPAAAPGAPAVVKAKLRVERSIAIGKWPERFVVLDGVAWVSESGARRVARVPLDGSSAPTHVGVGRLPVDIAVGPAGKLYVLAQTDNNVWEVDPASRKARIVATVPDCPASMVVDEGALWVLQWSKCSSADSSVVRVDLASARSTVSPSTGRNALSIGHAGGKAWVALGDGRLASVGGATLRDLKVHGAAEAGGTSRLLIAAAGGIYSTFGERIVHTDAITGEWKKAVTLADRITALAASADSIFAAGDSGTIWELDAATLAVRNELSATPDVAEPHGMVLWGDRLVVIVHDGEEGRIVVLAFDRAALGAPR